LWTRHLALDRIRVWEGLKDPKHLTLGVAQVCEGLKEVLTRLRGISKRAREGTSKGKSEGDAWVQGIEQAVAKAGEIYKKLKGGAARLGGDGVKLEWDKDGRPSEVPEGVGVEVVLKEARRREDSFVRRLEGGYGAGPGTEAGDGFEGGYEIREEIRGIDLKILGIETKIDSLLKRREKATMGLDALDDLGDLRDEGGRSHVDLFNDLVNVICRRDSSPAGSLGQRTRAYTEAKSMLEFEAWRKIQEEIEVLRTEEKACEVIHDNRTPPDSQPPFPHFLSTFNSQFSTFHSLNPPLLMTGLVFLKRDAG
jgi:hypothetical protein